MPGGEVFLDIGFNVGNGVCLGGISGYRDALGVHQELGEVPLDELPEEASLLVLQVHPQGVGVVAVHVNLGKHIKLDSELGRKLLDLLRCARLLVAELVTRKREDGEPWAVLSVQLHQLGVVHGRQSSLGGHVHDEHRFSSVSLQGNRVAIDVVAGEIIDTLRARCHYV